MMEALSSSETSVYTRAIWYNIRKDAILLYRKVNFSSGPRIHGYVSQDTEEETKGSREG
jgi:hypothetical protein